ncbi:MAG: hypothetical protein M1315_03145 [Candidatus Thermoplasmatota archaeon]|nr:hypothetical protein [Candidatus Thermoplasmatota archaeon]
MFKKTLLKGTVVILVFSAFLEISSKTLLNYFIFLAVFYAMLLFYIQYKRTTRFILLNDSMEIRTYFGKKAIKYSNIVKVFSNSGMLQRKFGLFSIYVIAKGRNYLLRDLPENSSFLSDLARNLKPYSLTVE